MGGRAVMDARRANAALVEALGSALREGDHGLRTVPALLARVLREESWRAFVTQRGEAVEHERFADFVTTPPLKGLGASMDLIDRIVGTSDPDLLRLLREAKSVGRGSAGRGRPSIGHVDSTSPNGSATDYAAARLAEQAPDEYEAVKRGEKTIHGAAVAAGIRKRRVPVRLDDPASAARTLRKHMAPDDLKALARLLLDEEGS